MSVPRQINETQTSTCPNFLISIIWYFDMYFVEGMAQYISITLSTIQGSTWPKDIKGAFIWFLHVNLSEILQMFAKIARRLFELIGQDDHFHFKAFVSKCLSEVKWKVVINTYYDKAIIFNKPFYPWWCRLVINYRINIFPFFGWKDKRFKCK